MSSDDALTPTRSSAGAPERSAEWGDIAPARNDTVIAVLGPTNTGKTHYAIERLLGHRSGVIGFPLRLLAREIYDRIVGMRGPRDVALITGEEKIVPPDARYYICTVESMPLDMSPDFVAVDEIQLCADPERGHVFTDRLLHARGKSETLFLGSATMWDRIAALAPGARFVTRERMSQLTYVGSKKLSRLPTRTAIVGFSTDNVYAIAELIRRQKGGAAVVMGALSPRTRNAQVALYQEGDVDYLVATDAIGMGLNMDVRHVAFSGLRKFDGRRHRTLEPNELAQIAGRAGRHVNDGTFGVTGEAPPLDDDVAHAIENHLFKPVERLHWRNARLDYATPFNLLLSLEREPNARDLQRARDADDVSALRHLSRMPDIVDVANGRARVRLLWDVCQIPDFRKTLPSEHAALLAEIYRFLCSDAGVVPEDWIAAQCARLDRVDGDIDALSKRLAYVRTWTYVANRGRWVRDPGHWRGRTREIEDKLSDALHARLTQRFVDRRTSVLARRLKEKETLVATVDDAGGVTVEGEYVGRLEGFRFEPDPAAAGAEVKTLQAASAQALQSELARRVEKFYGAPDSEIDVTEQGGMMWGASAVGRLEAAPENAGDPLAAQAVAFADEMLDASLREKIQRRLQFWIDRKLGVAFEPLLALKNDEALTGMARGVAFQIIERYGIIPRQDIAEDVKSLDQEARASLRKHGVRFGQYTIFIPALLKPAPTRFRILLWGLASKLPEIPSPPPPGAVTMPAAPQGLEDEAAERYYPMAGYRQCGPRALRLDMLERLADMIRGQDVRGGFEATPEMMSITGASLDQLAEMLEGLGFRAEKGERPKQPKPAPTAKATKRKAAANEGSQEAAKTAAAGAAKSPWGAASGAIEEPEESAGPRSPWGAAAAPDAPAAEAAAPDAPVAEVDAPAHDPAPAAEESAPSDQEPALAGHDAAPIDAAAETPPRSETAAPATEASSEASDTSTDQQPAPADQSEAVAVAETPDGEAAAAPPLGEAAADASSKPATDELETFYVFRLLPRGRRARGETREDGDRERGRQGRQRRADGPPRSDERGGKPRGKGGGKPNGKHAGGRHADGKGGGKPQKPREYSSTPKRGGSVDPDSPFAILQKLKGDS